MSTFPALVPSSRTFTPGEYPATAFSGYSGEQDRVRHSNVYLAAQLRLTFIGLPEADMLSIWSHYAGRRGGFDTFTLPAEITAGSDIADYIRTDYRWKYEGPGSVEDLPCGGHNVTLTLETVPPVAASVAGVQLLIRTRLAAGQAAGGTFAGGFSGSVTLSLAAGTAVTQIDGLAQTIALSLQAGAAQGDVFVDGASLTISMAYLTTGSTNMPGINRTIALSLVVGAADNGIEITARYWRITNISVIASFLELSELQFFDGTTRRLGTYSFQTAPTVGVTNSDLGNGNLSDSLFWTDATAESASFWIKIDLGSPAAVTGIKQARRGIADRHISAFTLQYSSDDSTWTTLGSASGIADPGSTTLSELIQVF